MARKSSSATFLTPAAGLAARFRSSGWRIAVAGGLLAPLTTSAVASAGDPVEPASIVEAAEEASTLKPIGEEAHFSEDSVLVATRKLADDTADSPGALEPIPNHSDQEPELADPRPTLAPPRETASAGDDSKQPAPLGDEPARVASRTVHAPLPVDPTDVASAYSAASKLEPARFHGIVPGVSTADELVAAWGEPIERSPTESGDNLLYEMPPFASVDVQLHNEVVEYIRVELDSQQEPDRLAKRLRLDKFKPVEILDEASEVVIGLAYPEKGMLLILAKPTESTPPGAPQFVTHMVIQPLDAEAFALRADQAAHRALESKLADLEQAIKVDPSNAYANWQLSELHRLTGAADKAEAAARTALETEPSNDAYRLRWAECLTDKGDYDTAVIEARRILDSDDAPSVVKAGALHLMGRLASMGDSGIADKSIGFHTMAIEIADRLATGADRDERRLAKHILVESHLAVAREISRRKYARKSDIVGEWIGRASGIAEEMIDSGDGDLELRLIVARESLAAVANLKPAKDPSPWVKEAEQTAAQLLAGNDDRMFRSRVEWQLGQAYFHAVRVEHSRKQLDSGLSYGNKAIERLQTGAEIGELRPSAESLVGRLFFHIGALYAVHKNDHEQAVTWYDKAEPLLTGDRPKSELAVPRRRGEALVSMAVSYWDQDQRDRAVRLTDSGAELMEDAVAGGVLDEKALAVPYGNLSTMHRRLGNRDQSAKFAKLARGARGAADLETPGFAEAVTRAQAASNARATKPSRPKQAAGTRPSKQAASPTRRTGSNRSASNSNGRQSASAKKTKTSSQNRQRTASSGRGSTPQSKATTKARTRQNPTRARSANTFLR